MRKLLLILLAVILPISGCLPITGTDFATLKVRVRTTTGSPVEGVWVELGALGEANPGSFDTSKNGEFVIVGIDPGEYEIAIRNPPAGYVLPPTQANPVLATVEPGRETTVSFTLARQ